MSTPNMSRSAYILSLSVENVRCFGPRQVLDLSDGKGKPAGWTIILGDNGSGKTTLLQCIAAMAPREVEYNDDIGAQAFVSHRGRDFPRDPKALLFRAPGETSSLQLQVLNASSTPQGEEYLSPWEFVETKSWPKGGNGHTSTSKGFVNSEPVVLCMAYGASRRMGKGSLSSDSPSDPVANLIDDDVPLVNAEEWLLQADYAAHSSSRPGAERRFEEVRQMLVNLLPDVSDLRIDGLDEERPKPAVEALTPFGWVPLKRLSLGYKTLIAWIVDLASRLYDAAPRSAAPLHTPAVVLIDEIDLHLHPTWQRKLMGYLSERFPNVQFIATAHSPLIVQAAQGANLAVLRRHRDHVVIDNDPGSVRGWRVDQILTSDLFGLVSARAPHLDPLIQERSGLLRKETLLPEDEARLDAIEEALKNLPYGIDADDIEAREFIKAYAEELRGEKGRSA